MTITTKSLVAGYKAASIKTYSSATAFIYKHANTMLLAAGVILLTLGVEGVAVAQDTYSEAAYNDGLVRGAVGNIFALIEGAFGALIMVVSGLAAIVAAAMGAYRAAVAMLVVAVGAFILRALVSLFFGEDFTAIGVDGGGN
jgi:hypothetical protein